MPSNFLRRLFDIGGHLYDPMKEAHIAKPPDFNEKLRRLISHLDKRNVMQKPSSQSLKVPSPQSIEPITWYDFCRSWCIQWWFLLSVFQLNLFRCVPVSPASL